METVEWRRVLCVTIREFEPKYLLLNFDYQNISFTEKYINIHEYIVYVCIEWVSKRDNAYRQ